VSQEIAVQQQNITTHMAANLERVLIGGDLTGLNPQERIQYYKAVCESVGLNPLTKPFDYLDLDGKLVLYAKRDCTDQLRTIHSVSIKIVSRELVDGVYVVTSQASKPDGRCDEAIGAVPLVKEGGEWKNSQNGKRYFQGNGTYTALSPDAKANAIMKAETKAKRRVTLSICGLGIMDESELDTVRNASPLDFDPNGTREAQVQVLERKLIEAGVPEEVAAAEAEKARQPKARKKPEGDAWIQMFFDAMEKVKEQLGEDAYYGVIQAEGCDNAQCLQKKGREEADRVYRLLLAKLKAKRDAEREYELGINASDRIQPVEA
jgi:hypothetical protein